MPSRSRLETSAAVAWFALSNLSRRDRSLGTAGLIEADPCVTSFTAKRSDGPVVVRAPGAGPAGHIGPAPRIASYVMLICFGRSAVALGTRMVRTPSSRWASIFLSSTSPGSMIS